jgi:hypothetical protein
VASVSFSGFFLRRFMRSRIQLRMLLCVTQAAKKLQAKSFFRREMHENLILTPRIAAWVVIAGAPILAAARLSAMAQPLMTLAKLRKPLLRQ